MGITRTVVSVPIGVTNTTRIDGFTIRNGNAFVGAAFTGLTNASPVMRTMSFPTIQLPMTVVESGAITVARYHKYVITGNTAPKSGGGIECFYASAVNCQ